MSAILGKEEIYHLLEEKGIAFEKLEHQAVYTMEDMDKAGITAKGTVCKNLFLRDAKGKKHFLVTVPEEKRVDLKILRIHSKIIAPFNLPETLATTDFFEFVCCR